MRYFFTVTAYISDYYRTNYIIALLAVCWLCGQNIRKAYGMKDKYSVWNSIKNPDIFAVCLIWIVTLAFVVLSVVMIAVSYTFWLSYVIYALTLIFVGYTIYTVVHYYNDIKQSILAEASKYKFTKKLFLNYGYRTIFFSIISFMMNIAYVVFNVFLSADAYSAWYASLAGYYLFLSILRFVVLFSSYFARKKFGEHSNLYYLEKLRIYRACGITLLILEVTLAGAVTKMVFQDNIDLNNPLLAVASGGYTVYKVTLAIINSVKVYRLNDPLLQSIRNINLMDAMVSLFALQTTLFALFARDNSTIVGAVNAFTGYAVSILTIAMGILMIVRASHKLKTKRIRRR